MPVTTSPHRQPSRQVDLELLTGADAGEFLQAALGIVDGELLAWRARQVEHRPGRGTIVGYQARVRWSGGATTDERFGACTGRLPDGVLVLQHDDAVIGVWRFPRDPYLPALAPATDPAALRRLLVTCGFPNPGAVTVRVRAYRPGRRAVVEVSSGAGRLFLKVVRPGRVAALHDRHRLLAAAGVPVAQSLGYLEDGLVVLQALPGRTLREVLCHQVRPTALPAAAAILGVLERLPAQLAEIPARLSWLDRIGRYAAVVGAALPEQAQRATQLATAIAAEAPIGAVVPVHGDLYESQLLVLNTQVTGLLDVDTAGPGERTEDLGCVLAHLSVLSQMAPARRGVINRLGGQYLASFDRTVDPAALRYRAAAVAMSLATGPHRVQEADWPQTTIRRLDLVEGWLDSARRARPRTHPFG